MLYVYRLKNNLVQGYGPLIFKPEDFATYSRRLHDLCILYPDQADKDFLNVSTLESVGKFDELSGVIDFFKPDQSADQTYNLQEAWEQLQALKARADGKRN